MKYYLTLDIDEMGVFAHLNEVALHFNNFIQLKLAGWEVLISTDEFGWGYYEIVITPECIKIGDLAIYEEADFKLNGVKISFYREEV